MISQQQRVALSYVYMQDHAGMDIHTRRYAGTSMIQKNATFKTPKRR